MNLAEKVWESSFRLRAVARVEEAVLDGDEDIVERRVSS